MLLYALIIFLLASAVSFALLHAHLPNAARARAEKLIGNSHSIDWQATSVRVARRWSQWSIPAGRQPESVARQQLLSAGIRSPAAPVLFYGAKSALPVVAGGFAYLLLQAIQPNWESLTRVSVVLAAALAGYVLPNLILRLAIHQRQREIFEQFPDMVDFLLVCVEAGVGLDSALLKVAGELASKSRILADEIHLTNLETRAGIARDQALRNLAMRTGVAEIHSFATTLAQADQFGTSLGDALRVFASDLRHQRQLAAEVVAAKVPTKLLFPLVLCIFPSISMVILGPAAIRMVRLIQPMLAGQN